MITETAHLAAFCKRVAASDYVTIDTEFIRDKTYWPLLCLIQIANQDEAAAVDTLAPDIDLGPVFELIADRSTVKVFHAARQDVEIFHHIADCIPSPLFDTQVAAMVCGYGESVGYERLAASLANARIDKSMRFTDWSHRPLSSKQIDYALADVTHLRRIYDTLKKRLEDSGREEWVAEEIAVLTDPNTYRLAPEDAWRRLRTRNRNRRFLAILRELAAWRESEARNRDVPRSRVLRDDTLTEVAAHAPKTADDLKHLRAFPYDSRSKAVIETVLQLVKKGEAVPDNECPEPPAASARTPLSGGSVDLLKVLLKKRCEEHEVAQKLVASADDIEAIARDDNAEVPALHGWRRRIFGEDALALKKGQLALTTDGREVKVIRTGA